MVVLVVVVVVVVIVIIIVVTVVPRHYFGFSQKTVDVMIFANFMTV